jgi:hypothetical protein
VVWLPVLRQRPRPRAARDRRARCLRLCRWVDEKMIKPKDKKTEQSDEQIIEAAKKGDVRIV